MNYVTEYVRKTCVDTVNEMAVVTSGISLNGKEPRTEKGDLLADVKLLDVVINIYGAKKDNNQRESGSLKVLSICIDSDGESYCLEIVCANDYYANLFIGKITDKMMTTSNMMMHLAAQQDLGNGEIVPSTQDLSKPAQITPPMVYLNDWERRFFEEYYQNNGNNIYAPDNRSKLDRIWQDVLENDFEDMTSYGHAIASSKTASAALAKMREAKSTMDFYHLGGNR